MKNYKEFYINMILESIFQVHDNFKEIINKISDDPIAGKLLDLFGKDLKIQHNFLQKGDDNDQVYFIPDSQSQKVSDPWVKKNAAKVGRLVNQILTSQGIKIVPADLEKFINRYKTAWKESLEVVGKDPVLLVKGDDIKYWYNKENYLDDEEGTLGNSCMRYKRCQSYFRIYTENPEVCQLAILLNEDDKLIGRCLVWKMDDGGTYIDRIYTRWDNDEEFIYNFLKKKFPNSLSYYNDDNDDESITIKLTKDYSDEFKKPINDVTIEFPYMDSLMYFYPLEGILTNIEDSDKFYISIQNTSGGFSQKGNIVWSDYENRFIDSSEGVYKFVDGDWLPESILGEDICGDFYKKDDLVYSDLYGGLINNPVKTKWGLAPQYDMINVNTGSVYMEIPGIFNKESRFLRDELNDPNKYPIFDYFGGEYYLLKNLKTTIDSLEKYVIDGYELISIKSRGYVSKLIDTGRKAFEIYFHGIYPIGISNIVSRYNIEDINSDVIYLNKKWLDLLPINLDYTENTTDYIKTESSYNNYLSFGISNSSWSFILYINNNEKIKNYFKDFDILLREHRKMDDDVKKYLINYINNLCDGVEEFIKKGGYIDSRYGYEFTKIDPSKIDSQFIHFFQKLVSGYFLGYSLDIRNSRLIGNQFKSYRGLDDFCDNFIRKFEKINPDINDNIILRSISFNSDEYEEEVKSLNFKVKLFD